jgi:hypothetical protein
MDLVSNLDISPLFFPDILNNTVFLAQDFSQFDIIADFQEAWTNFVESGQVWALLIGLFLGYIFKSFTSFG